MINKDDAKIHRTIFGCRCWKVLFRDMDGRYYAPYFEEFEYRLGEVAHSGIEIIGDEISGLHSFVFEKDAILERDDWNLFTGKIIDGEYVVVRCRIPFGGRYISGMTLVGGKYVNCYASEKLFIKSPKTV